MRNSLLFAGVTIFLLGCRLPPDRQDLNLLDEGRELPSYAELYLRARSQATLALEAFYVDGWADLDTAARALEQSARFMPKSKEIPEPLNATLARDSSQLQADAGLLGEAARSKNVRAANEVLQRIQFEIRTLRPPVGND